MKHQIIIIASIGRCGSTMLMESMNNTPCFVQDIGNINNADFVAPCILKTHSTPPAYLPKGAKVIYLFADPIDVILSSHSPKVNLQAHYAHMGGNFEEREMFMHKDVLCLEAQFDAWMQGHPYPMLSIRYETMWDHIGQIREFAGYHIDLPEFQRREALVSQYSNYEQDILKGTYGALAKKIEEAADLHEWKIVK